MIQLNLLPDLKKEFLKSQKTKGVVISGSILVTIGALGLSALLFVYVTFLQQIQIGLATDDIKAKESQLKAIPDVDKYLTIQAQLASLPDLHNNKGSYSRLFDYLGVINPSAPNNVNLSNLQLSTADKSIALTGTTASFETLNVFVDTLKNAQVGYKKEGQTDTTTEKMFDQVLVQSSGFARIGSQNLVSFSIKTVYKDSAFDVRNSDAKAGVPNITTTQSVTQSPTKQIFNDKAQP
jgi:Tfp pilus assembly protein PilN